MKGGKIISIIAEIGSVHDGSFGNAINLVSLAKECGADCVKFQTHIPHAETLKNAPAPSYFQGEPRYDYFKRTSFSLEQWKKLKIECDNQKIEFISSPFSLEAVELLEEVGVNKYKIPSGEVTNLPMIELIASTKKPIFLSSGMSTWDELDQTINKILNYHNNIVVMQCTSEYPCQSENVGLNIINQMKKRYSLPVGFSDHTADEYAAFAASTLGVEVIEKHLTFSKKMYGSDAKHSLEPTEFKRYVRGIHAINNLISLNVNKDEIAKKMYKMKEVFEKSIVSVVNIPKNTIIKEHMIGLKKPGTGIPASRISEVLGNKAVKNINPDTLILRKDLAD